MSRQRCLTVGCNPRLKSEAAAANHAKFTGHRTAKWPARSEAGRRAQRERNRRQLGRVVEILSPSHSQDGEAE